MNAGEFPSGALAPAESMGTGRQSDDDVVENTRELGIGILYVADRLGWRVSGSSIGPFLDADPVTKTYYRVFYHCSVYNIGDTSHDAFREYVSRGGSKEVYAAVMISPQDIVFVPYHDNKTGLFSGVPYLLHYEGNNIVSCMRAEGDVSSEHHGVCDIPTILPENHHQLVHESFRDIIPAMFIVFPVEFRDDCRQTIVSGWCTVVWAYPEQAACVTMSPLDDAVTVATLGQCLIKFGGLLADSRFTGHAIDVAMVRSHYALDGRCIRATIQPTSYDGRVVPLIDIDQRCATRLFTLRTVSEEGSTEHIRYDLDDREGMSAGVFEKLKQIAHQEFGTLKGAAGAVADIAKATIDPTFMNKIRADEARAKLEALPDALVASASPGIIGRLVSRIMK